MESTNGTEAYISSAIVNRRGDGTPIAKRCYHSRKMSETRNPMAESKDTPLRGSTSEAVTNNVRVEVESRFAPELSQPFDGQWVFTYTIRITNEGDETVQLLSRHWIITHATGNTEEVRGSGVVGEQPVLAPGETFQYTSRCSL